MDVDRALLAVGGIAPETTEKLLAGEDAAGLGRERPVSTKLRWWEDTPERSASSSWLSRRRCRHSRSSEPTAGRVAGTAMSRS